MCKNWDDICIRPRLCDPSSFTKKSVRKKELTRWSEIGMEFCGGSTKLRRTKKCTLPPLSIIVGKVFSLIAYIIMSFPCRSDNNFTKLIFNQEIDILAWTIHLHRNNLSWRIWSCKHQWICHQRWKSETWCTGIRCRFWEKEGKKFWQENWHWKQQWRWKLHKHCLGDGVLMLLLRGAFCASAVDDSSSSFFCCFVCVWFYWLLLAGLSIRMSSETHTHTHTHTHTMADRSQVALGFQRGDSAVFKMFRPSARERRT